LSFHNSRGKSVSVAAVLAACGAIGAVFALGSGDAIDKANFDFGHQLGYIYSRTDSAYFRKAGEWTFETGFLDYYESRMPFVRNPHWRERNMLLVPLLFEIYPCSTIAIQAALTDLFVEFPCRNIHSMGGKSPRFMTKMRLLKEGRFLPATAFTVGVKFSSAKPYNIWENTHNYDESNGLAGACTGVSDYLMLFTLSKRLSPSLAVHGRFGLAPLGSPVPRSITEPLRTSNGQADEIPYGVMVTGSAGSRFCFEAGIIGMYPMLSTTILGHYSQVRLAPAVRFGRVRLTLDVEKGLTRESDEWVAGVYTKFDLGKEKRR
jgi:hypothetical protein